MARGSDLAVWAELLRMLLSHCSLVLFFIRFLNVCFANSLGFFFVSLIVLFSQSISLKKLMERTNKKKMKSPSKWLQNKHAWQSSRLAQPLNCVWHLTSKTPQARSLLSVCRCCVCVCVSKVFGLECYANSCIICLGLSLNKLQLQN